MNENGHPLVLPLGLGPLPQPDEAVAGHTPGPGAFEDLVKSTMVNPCESTATFYVYISIEIHMYIYRYIYIYIYLCVCLVHHWVSGAV